MRLNISIFCSTCFPSNHRKTAKLRVQASWSVVAARPWNTCFPSRDVCSLHSLRLIPLGQPTDNSVQRPWRIKSTQFFTEGAWWPSCDLTSVDWAALKSLVPWTGTTWSDSTSWSIRVPLQTPKKIYKESRPASHTSFCKLPWFLQHFLWLPFPSFVVKGAAMEASPGLVQDGKTSHKSGWWHGSTFILKPAPYHR